MLIPVPFRLFVRSGCPAQADLALSLAAEFEPVDPQQVETDLRALEATTPWVDPDPVEQLAAVGSLVRTAIEPVENISAADLLIHRALACGRAAPNVLAVVLAHLGQRRGWSLGIVGNHERLYVGHAKLEDPLLLDPATGVVHEAAELGPPLRWRCAHETAGELLRGLETCWEREGDLVRAIRAAEMRLELPLDTDSLARAQERVGQLRARFN